MVGDENNNPRRELTVDQRSEIIGVYKCGVKGTTIAEKLGVPLSTVYDTIDRYNKTGSPHPQNRPGWPKVLSERDERALVRIANSDRDATLADITEEISNILGQPISTKTTGKYLNKLARNPSLPTLTPKNAWNSVVNIRNGPNQSGDALSSRTSQDSA